MQDLIEAIKAWPVIVQGALGSALFWLVLQCGQSITSRILKIYSHHSKRARLSWLISAQSKYEGDLAANNDDHMLSIVVLIYRSSRHLIKAFMWLVMGFIFEPFIFPAGVIGFCGSLYYLFKAYEIVSPIDYNEDSEAILRKINQEIEALEKSEPKHGSRTIKGDC